MNRNVQRAKVRERERECQSPFKTLRNISVLSLDLNLDGMTKIKIAARSFIFDSHLFDTYNGDCITH